MTYLYNARHGHHIRPLLRERIMAAARRLRWLADDLAFRFQQWRGCVCHETSTRNCKVHAENHAPYLTLVQLGMRPEQARHALADVEMEPPDDWSPAEEWGDDTLSRMVEEFEIHHQILPAPVRAEHATPTQVPDRGGEHHRMPVLPPRPGSDGTRWWAEDVSSPEPLPAAPPEPGPATPDADPVRAADLAVVAVAILNAPLQNQESAWTKRDAAFLAIEIARRELDRFDHISAYATSGITPRWAGVA